MNNDEEEDQFQTLETVRQVTEESYNHSEEIQSWIYIKKFDETSQENSSSNDLEEQPSISQESSESSQCKILTFLFLDSEKHESEVEVPQTGIKISIMRLLYSFFNQSCDLSYHTGRREFQAEQIEWFNIGINTDYLDPFELVKIEHRKELESLEIQIQNKRNELKELENRNEQARSQHDRFVQELEE